MAAPRRGRPRKNPLLPVVEEPAPKRARRTPRRPAGGTNGVAPGPWGNFDVDDETKELRRQVEKAMLRQQLVSMERGKSPLDSPLMQPGMACSAPPRLSHTDQLEGHNLRFAECFKDIEDLCGRMGKLEAKVG